jgi:putative ABC transport system permease protein
MLSVAAAILLMIACVNYTNLSTAVIGLRAKEIGVRKVCGSHRKDLFGQIISESLCLAFFSAIFALFLVSLFLPIFNQYSGAQLAFKSLFNMKIIIGLLGITVLTGFLSGCYPAFYLSSLPSVDLFKRSILLVKKRRISLRHVLVVFQFALAISVMISAAVFSRQFRFIQSKFDSFDLGNTLVVVDWTFAQHHEQVKRDLLQNPHIINVSQSAIPGAALSPSSEISWPGKVPGDEPVFFHARIDHDFYEVMKPKIVEGRFFSREIASDESQFLVNETAVRIMGMTSPIGQRISYKGKEGAIIGVVQDRHFASLRYRIPPMVYEINHNYPHFNIKVDRSENIPKALEHINQTRKKYPDYRPVSYWLAEDRLSHYMKTEHTLSRVFSYVTFLTMILASLGLFGLSLFHASQKTKEIGIRKVLGCSEARIVGLLTQEFIKWVLLANIIAWPVAYFLMKRWLQNYAYRVDVGLLTFAMAGATALAVALITIAYRSIKAATANPVDSLRYE